MYKLLVWCLTTTVATISVEGRHGTRLFARNEYSGVTQNEGRLRLCRIAFLGNAITEETYESSHGPSRDTDAGDYPAIFSALAHDSLVASFDRVGVTASPVCPRTNGPYAKTYAFADAVRWDAHIYVLMLGTSDVISCWDADTFESRLEDLGRTLLDLSRSVKLALVVPPPLDGLGSYDRILRVELTPRVMSVANRLRKEVVYASRVISIDPRAEFARECAVDRCAKESNLSEYRACFCSTREFYADGVHLNVLGADVLARTVLKALDEENWIPKTTMSFTISLVGLAIITVVAAFVFIFMVVSCFYA